MENTKETSLVNFAIILAKDCLEDHHSNVNPSDMMLGIGVPGSESIPSLFVKLRKGCWVLDF